MLEIYSIQDPSVLRSAFNGMAAIFSDGAYSSAATVVSLFTIFALAVNSIHSGNKEMPFTTWFIGAIIFIGGFTTLTEVSIEDRYTSQVTQIDNIPVAVSAPASVITSIGYKMTELTETAYGHTGDQRITSAGYLSPLQTMVDLRKATMTGCPSGITGSKVGSMNLCGSLKNYVQDCVNVKAALNGHSYDIEQKNVIEAIMFESDAYSTVLYDEDMNPTAYSCKDAGDAIKAVYDSGSFEDVADNIKLDTNAASDQTMAEKTSSALQAITSDTLSERDMLFSMYMLNPIDEGTVAYLMDNGASGMAENLASSITQRNYEWLVQGEMWLMLVNKFLALMESVLYTISPFIGLMVLTGSMGKKTLGLYIQLLIVMQLIPPMTVIVQDIIMADVDNKYEALLAQGLAFGSIEFTREFSRYCMEQLALGGLYASAIVPTLAFSLVTGSAHAMSSVFKSGAATPKDTDTVKDMTNQGGENFNLGNQISHKVQNGTIGTDQEIANMGEIKLGNAASAAVSAAETDVESASQKFNNSSSFSEMEKTGASLSTSERQSIGQSVLSGKTEAAQLIQQQVSEQAKKHSLNESQQADLAATLLLAGETGISTPAVLSMAGLSGKATAGARLEGRYGNSVSEATEDALSSKRSVSGQSSFQDQYAESAKNDYANDRTIQTSNEAINQNQHQRSLAYEEVEQSQSKLEQAEKFERNVSSQSTSDKLAMLSRLSSNDDVVDRMRTERDNQFSTQDKEDYNRYMAEYKETQSKLTQEEQEMAAFLQVAPYAEDVRLDNVLFGGGLTTNTDRVDSDVSVNRGDIAAHTDYNPNDFNVDDPIGQQSPTERLFKNGKPDLKGDFDSQAKHMSDDNHIIDEMDVKQKGIATGAAQEIEEKDKEFTAVRAMGSVSQKAIDTGGEVISAAKEGLEMMGGEIKSAMDDQTKPTPAYDMNTVQSTEQFKENLQNEPELSKVMSSIPEPNSDGKFDPAKVSAMLDDMSPSSQSNAQDLYNKLDSGAIDLGSQGDNYMDAYERSSMRRNGDIPLF